MDKHFEELECKKILSTLLKVESPQKLIKIFLYVKSQFRL